MKSMRTISFQMLSLLFLTSCEQGNAPMDTPALPTDVPCITSVSLPGASTATRTIITGIENAPEGGAAGSADKLSGIGICAIGTDGTEYRPVRGTNTAVYQKKRDGWFNPSRKEATNLFLPSGDKLVYIYAWHPSGLTPDFEAGNNYLTDIKILAEDDFKATNQTDYLYAYGYTDESTKDIVGVNSTNNSPLKFCMQHALAKLTFTVKKGDKDESLHLTEFMMNTSDASGFRTGDGSTRRMSFENGEFANLLSASTLTYKDADSPEVTTAGITVTALVAPVTDLRQISFKMTMTVGDSDTRIYRTRTLATTTWVKGKEYKYTLVAYKLSAEIEGDAEVNDWTTEVSDIPIQ